MPAERAFPGAGEALAEKSRLMPLPLQETLLSLSVSKRGKSACRDGGNGHRRGAGHVDEARQPCDGSDRILKHIFVTQKENGGTRHIEP